MRQSAALCNSARAHYKPPIKHGETTMPKMGDGRRKAIQLRQRKIENAAKRAAKIAKRQRNAKA
jgi:hypothetical protein